MANTLFEMPCSEYATMIEEGVCANRLACFYHKFEIELSGQRN